MFKKLDPRNRILWMFVVSAMALSFRSWLPLAIIVASEVPVWILAGKGRYMMTTITLRVIPFLLFLAAVQTIGKIFVAGPAGLEQAAESIGMQMVRVYVMITASVLMFQTTMYPEIMTAIRALKTGTSDRWNRFVEKAAFAIGTGYQFIPLLVDELGAMTEVRRARGDGVREGGKLEQARKALRMGVPMLNRVFELIRNLLLALVNYHYAPDRVRTQYRYSSFTSGDWLFFGSMAVCVAAMLIVL